jgi:DNA primase
MFPIRDVQGRTVGFGGRILPDSPNAVRGPKYYNTADTLLFNKSDNVFGIDLARHAGSGAGYLAVVEGYTDVMMAHQCGIANVVATMGTALNERHIAQLRRYVPKIVLVFDADAGGERGIGGALELFISTDLELSIAQLPQGLDPADLLAEEGGVTVFQDALSSAADALDFKLNQLLRSGSTTVEATRGMLDSVLGMLALAPPVPNQATQIKRDLMLTRLSHRLGLELNTVRRRLLELQADRKRGERYTAERQDEPIVVSVQTSTVAVAKAATGASGVLERQLVQVLLAEPGLVPKALELISWKEISHTGLQRILIELFALHESGSVADLDGLRIRLLDRPDLAGAAMQLQEVGRGIPDRPVYLTKIIDGFAAERRKAGAKAVREQLLAASSDDEAALALLRRLQGPTE